MVGLDAQLCDESEGAWWTVGDGRRARRARDAVRRRNERFNSNERRRPDNVAAVLDERHRIGRLVAHVRTTRDRRHGRVRAIMRVMMSAMPRHRTHVVLCVRLTDGLTNGSPCRDADHDGRERKCRQAANHRIRSIPRRSRTAGSALFYTR